jgi:inorganic phosphate transporter, PiT family
MDSLTLGLAAALSFIFGWNNSSFLVGNLRGAGSVSFRAAMSVSVAGLVLGVLLEGPKMTGSMTGSVAPSTTSAILLATLAVSVGMTLVLTLLKLPVSFSMVMVAAFLGATYAVGLAVNVGRSLEVIGYWFAAPVLSGVFTFVVYALVTRSIARLGLLTVDSFNRAGALVSAFVVAYTLGANNIGLIYASAGGSGAEPGQSEVLLLFTLAAVVAVLVLGGGGLGGTVGDRMLALSPQGVFSMFVGSSLVVWAGTQLALPVSIGQCIIGGMLGAAYTRAVTVLNRRLVGETVSLWVVAPIVAFVLGFVLVQVA